MNRNDIVKTFKTALLMASLVAGPALAQGYVPNERLTYTPTENGVRISGSTGFGARGHWCAAAGYAGDQMGAADRQTLYVSEPRARGFANVERVSRSRFMHFLFSNKLRIH